MDFDDRAGIGPIEHPGKEAVRNRDDRPKTACIGFFPGNRVLKYNGLQENVFLM